MLEYFCIFSKGGAILWTFQLAALKGNPIQALINTCLLEERSAEKSFTYTPKDGTPYSLKWRLHNELGLVFVAIYQRALPLLYVDDLLDRVMPRFTSPEYYHPKRANYDSFNDAFRQLLLECENRAAEKPRAQQVKGAKAGTNPSGSNHRNKGSRDAGGEDDEEDDDDDSGSKKSGGEAGEEEAESSPQDSEGAEDAPAGSRSTETMEDRLKKLKIGKRGSRSKAHGGHKDGKKEEKKEQKKKTMRNWNNLLANGHDEEQPKNLNFGCDSPEDAANVVTVTGPSGMDVEEEVQEIAADVESEKKGGFLASMVRSLKVNIVGGEAIRKDDIEPALEALKKKLMERNVGHDIVGSISDSVAASLEGKKLSSFTRVSKVVYSAVEEALTRILTPSRSIDILREIQANKSKPGNRPYVITFVGVNGVGKSTNLAKVAYWLIQHKLKVMIAACDTFRSGAVEQLRTHSQRLGIALYERGYEKDPAKVAAEAIKQAERDRVDVLLVDTAGRMQDNEPLMRSLAHLISLNKPELVLFVGEALVGNDAIDQLCKFNQRLTDLADSTRERGQAIDGIVLTKFDTIDDKVGAAISMVYTSRSPVMFVGCGQTYVDLKRLNVKEVVNSLLQ